MALSALVAPQQCTLNYKAAASLQLPLSRTIPLLSHHDKEHIGGKLAVGQAVTEQEESLWKGAST